MAQTTKGLRAVLSHPAIYDTLQALMGARKARRDLVRSFVRPSPGMRVLDIGCGTAAILGHLPADVRYWGCDISEEYIAAARRRFQGRGQFHCGPIDELREAGLSRCDVALAIGVLHHLDDDVAATLVERVHGMLVANGRLITVDPCLVPGQHPVARYLIRHDRGRNVRDRAGYLRIAHTVFPKVTGTFRHQKWVPYTNWIMECRA